MRRRCRTAIALSISITIALSVGAPRAARGQDVVSTGTPGDQAARNATLPRFGVWLAGSPSAPISNHSSLPHDRALVLLGLERQFRLVEGKWGTIATAPSLLPVVYTTGNRRSEQRECGSPGTFMLCVVPVRYSAFGVGVMPLSVRAQTSTDRRIIVAVRADGGGVRFTQRVPAESGIRFNFIAQAGADIEMRMTHNSWVLLGYRHVHLSNGGFANVNPGLDAPLATLGMAWR